MDIISGSLFWDFGWFWVPSLFRNRRRYGGRGTSDRLPHPRDMERAPSEGKRVQETGIHFCPLILFYFCLKFFLD